MTTTTTTKQANHRQQPSPSPRRLRHNNAETSTPDLLELAASNKVAALSFSSEGGGDKGQLNYYTASEHSEDGYDSEGGGGGSSSGKDRNGPFVPPSSIQTEEALAEYGADDSLSDYYEELKDASRQQNGGGGGDYDWDLGPSIDAKAMNGAGAGDGGVAVTGLLGELLGIGFLPYDRRASLEGLADGARNGLAAELDEEEGGRARGVPLDDDAAEVVGADDEDGTLTNNLSFQSAVEYAMSAPSTPVASEPDEDEDYLDDDLDEEEELEGYETPTTKSRRRIRRERRRAAMRRSIQNTFRRSGETAGRVGNRLRLRGRRGRTNSTEEMWTPAGSGEENEDVASLDQTGRSERGVPPPSSSRGRRRRGGKQRDSGAGATIESVQGEIDEQLALLESDRTKLEKQRRTLVTVESSAEAVARDAAEIAARVSNMRREMTNLEKALAIYAENLDRNRDELVQKREELDRLDKERVKVGKAMLKTQEAVRKRAGSVERLKAMGTEHASSKVAVVNGDGAGIRHVTSMPELNGSLDLGLSQEQQRPATPTGHEHPSLASAVAAPLPRPPLPSSTPTGTDSDLLTPRAANLATDAEVPLRAPSPTTAALLSIPTVEHIAGAAPDISAPLPPRPKVTLKRSSSSSFIRAHDLDIPSTSSHGPDGNGNEESENSSSSSNDGAEEADPSNNTTNPDYFYMDNNIKAVFDALNTYGLELIKDERTEQWMPNRETEKILSRRGKPCTSCPPGFPSDTQWHHATGKEVLVWSGKVNHTGFGSDLPIIKCRGIIPTSARSLVDLLLDSSRVKEYNKMSLGRSDELIIQEGVETRGSDSDYGLDGEVKIVRSSNKPPIVRKTVEVLLVLNSRELDEDAGEGRGYLNVSRSVWESLDAIERGGSGDKSVMRSEMLLGVNLIRPVEGTGTDDDGCCELSTVTQVYSKGVPLMVARRMAPGVAASFIRDIQNVFE